MKERTPAGVLTELEGDSEDFTEEEARSAVICGNVEKVSEHIRSQSCPRCQGPIVVTRGNNMRIRGQFRYWRMELCCADLFHPAVPLVVRMDWLSC